MESEMLLPNVLAWMKQRNELPRLRIKGGEIRTLVQIAVRTGQAKIGETVIPDMLAPVDVLDVKCQERSGRLWQSAVFTTIMGAFPDLCAGQSVHQAVPGVRSSRFLALICSNVTN